ncbi:MDR family NADP-dependent oxidoreductase [Phytoactinopolyspora endophytica]|uniref:MDR family NADP-dependent oxidoreductase n=1 Tax=Phytoactinopolyspora endophytica TaxID=1642495 RepID=UPI00101C9B96|nr:NADP-dependent oxidoreductase [Phytoactinopolyspora endophytica]
MSLTSDVTEPRMTRLATRSREVRFASRPNMLHSANLELAQSEVTPPGEGQILVRNTWMSVDPHVFSRMDDVPTPVRQPFMPGRPLDGGAVGEVVVSKAAGIPVGATVLHSLGWREYAVVDAAAALVVNAELAPPQAYLGVLGLPGLTAYAALIDVAAIQRADVVFISGAASPVGSVAGQIARKLGASTVIGSAGGPDETLKVLDASGFDMIIDHNLGSVGIQLGRVAPDGIDVFIDNVGGDLLVAAIDALRTGGRAALVDSESSCNARHPVPGPHNLAKVIDKQLTLRGVQVSTYLPTFDEYIQHAATWFAEGDLRADETTFEGLEQVSTALVASTCSVGTVLVRLS